MSLIKVKVRGQESVGRRNIIINGAMQLAQRGTSSTTSGYQTADRFTNTDERATSVCYITQLAQYFCLISA